MNLSFPHSDRQRDAESRRSRPQPSSPQPSSPLASSPQLSSSQLPAARLQRWLAVLAAIAALACLRALLLPPWPQVRPLQPQAIEPLLRQAGLDPRPLPSQPPHRNAGLALSARPAWRLQAGAELRLASVQVRRRDDFQLAWITRGLPALALQHRRLDDPQPGVVSGRLQGRPALQTCLVPQGASAAVPAATGTALQQAVDRQPRSRADRLAALLGLRQPRELRCLLVSLQSTTAQPLPGPTWQRLLAALQAPTALPRRL